MNFGIPAYKTASGKVTCPFADKCVKFCYAKKGAYIWSNVKPAFERRYEATKSDTFVADMLAEIDKSNRGTQQLYIRVHDSGDYYSPKYALKWREIALKRPNVRFYSYTNSISIVKGIEWPQNYDFIFSDSGKQIHLINPSVDRHTQIFKSVEALRAAGASDAHEYDLYATKWYSQDTNLIGLIYH